VRVGFPCFFQLTGKLTGNIFILNCRFDKSPCSIGVLGVGAKNNRELNPDEQGI
jgi:hypothetical protein